MLIFFLLAIFSKSKLNIYPFIRNGRSVQNIGNTHFLLYDTNPDNNVVYEYNYGDNSNTDITDSNLTNHLFEFPGQYTIMVSKSLKGSEHLIKGYAQKKISVEHVQEFYTFIVMGPFENITNDDQITNDLEKIPNSQLKYNSLEYNSIPISPNTSYWKLQIADNEQPSDDITKYYLDSGLEPKITVTNSSIQITVAKYLENMWVLKISANEVEPVSIAAKFEIYSSNLLLNPAGSNIYFTTRVFWIDIYDMINEAQIPPVTVKISPVSISQNSGVYVYDGSIYMTDDSYTTFHKLKFKELNTRIEEAVFCTTCFACTSDNKIYYRNYFVNDTLVLIPNHPQEIDELHIFSVESDDIPRETIASDIYDIAGPFFASYKSTQTNHFSVLRFNGTTQIINLDNYTNITSITYVTPISNVDWVIAIVDEVNDLGEYTSSIIQINFRTLIINRIDCYSNLLDKNEKIIGGYLQPYTEELISYTSNLVFISYDSGKTQTIVGKIQNGVASITSRHSGDEVYILDNKGNFYILFGERKIMHLFETYNIEGLSLAVDSADTVYLLTDEKGLEGCRAIPVECYINCFAIDHNFEYINEPQFSLEVIQSIDGQSYSFMMMPNNQFYFNYLSLFSTEGVEECKYLEDATCKRLYNGEVFSSFTNFEIDEFVFVDDESYSYSITFIENPDSNNYLKKQDIGKSLFILDILVIFEITGSDSEGKTFYLRNTSKVLMLNQNLNQTTATCQIIDLRPHYNSNDIQASIIKDSTDYEIQLDAKEEYEFTQHSVGLIVQSTQSDNSIFKGVIYNYINSKTVKVKSIDEFGGALDQSSVMTIRSPYENEDESDFSLEPSRKAPWHLGFSLCGGQVESQGTSSFHQNLPVYRLIEDEDLIYEMTIPSDRGTVQTRYSQPDLVLSKTNITNHQFVYTMLLNQSIIIDTPSSSTATSGSSGATESYNSISSRFSIPFTRVISLYKDGSPKCPSLSVIGVSPLCPADQRLVVTPDDEDREIVELDVNYRPPSVEGNQIGLSKNVYNRNPEVSKILKSKLKKSREKYAPVPNRCKNAKDIAGCHCERAELEKMNEEDTDCLKVAYSHDFATTFSPRVHLQSYIGGTWVVVDPEPQVFLTEVNGRTDLCVNGKCTKNGDDEVPFQTGDEIQMKGIELWHLKFRTIGSCSVSCYYMMYIKRPPLMRNMVYLIQGHAAIFIGIVLWIMATVVIILENKDRKSKQDTKNN